MREPGAGIPVPPLEMLFVRGLGGDRRALAELLAEEHEAEVLAHRLGPALALRARALGLGPAEGGALARALRSAAGRKVLLEHHLSTLGEALASAGIGWLPIKGFDLGSRAYARPEERPAGDIDILIEPAALPEARRVLDRAGWQGRATGQRFERFLEEEAYCWQARREDGTELEVHYRLWGMVPQGYPAAIFDRALPDRALGATARRSHPADAYLIAALHPWMDPPPRPLLCWWDLEQISRLGARAFSQEVLACARRWGLQLPVFLAAGHTAGLWPEGAHGEIASALAGELRVPEGRIAARARRQGTDHVRLAPLTLARLLSRRPSRSGWTAVRRRLWPHPGVVERSTPQSWPWLARRWGYLARQRGWSRLSRWLDSRFGGV